MADTLDNLKKKKALFVVVKNYNAKILNFRAENDSLNRIIKDIRAASASK